MRFKLGPSWNSGGVEPRAERNRGSQNEWNRLKSSHPSHLCLHVRSHPKWVHRCYSVVSVQTVGFTLSGKSGLFPNLLKMALLVLYILFSEGTLKIEVHVKCCLI